jgi:AraC family ethanolamine operon transcriptional activator
LGLSRRTLQNACQEVIGMSPVQYLRALRLSEARRMMQSARSVTEVATQFGFWHLGYFSRDYQMMFDELPSKTLQRWRTGGGVKDTRPRRLQRPFPS